MNAGGLPALTERQPYATLMALGVKTILTRSWPAPKALIGQLMGIHAAKRVPPLGDTAVGRIFRQCSPDGRVLVPWDAPISDEKPPVRLPLGAIVATGVLADCVPILSDDVVLSSRLDGDALFVCTNGMHTGLWLVSRYEDDLSDQLPYGDFGLGRWAWLYEDVKPTTERCPACWGVGNIEAVADDGGRWAPLCPTCKGAGAGDAVPARGRQGVWRWTP